MLKTSLTRRMPVKGPRLRKCAVKGCANRFQPRNMGHKVCGEACAAIHTAAERKRLSAKQAKQERATDRARREALKTKPEWLKEAQKEFNAYCRLRDELAGHACICCGRTNVKDYLTGSAWDAGHFRSVGSAPHLRFNEDNVHRQLVHCNRHGVGRAVDYRLGLIARIGLARVEALEADDTPRHYTIDELKAIKATYRAKLRALKEAA